MTNEQKIEAVKKVIEKAKRNIKELNQDEFGILTKLSYGAKLNNFTDEELSKVN